MKHSIGKNDYRDLPSEGFFEAIEAVCREYGLSIAHEDIHGGFVIEPFGTFNILWLRQAHFTENAAKQILVI